MNLSNIASLVTILAFLLAAGGVGSLLTARSINRKSNADAEVTLSSGWRVLYTEQRVQIRELRAQNKEQQDQFVLLRERFAVIEAREAECRERLSRLEIHGSPAVERKVVSLIDQKIAEHG